jgi:hypothetical protein
MSLSADGLAAGCWRRFDRSPRVLGTRALDGGNLTGKVIVDISGSGSRS